MADFAKPVVSDGYVDLLANIRDLFAELTKQLDASTASNIPTGAIRFNSTTKRREKYNGTSWAELVAKASAAYDERVAQADKLTTARTITLSGAVGGSASFDGSANVTLTVTLADASTTTKGRVELATDAETITGTDTVRATTPAGVKAAIDDAAYSHPSGDGNLHVPATGTSNNGKVLTAGSTAGSASWQTPAAPADASSTTKGIVELATSAETIAGTDAVRATTPAGVAAAIDAITLPTASSSLQGIVELATNAETVTGTDTARATTPAGVAAAIDAAAYTHPTGDGNLHVPATGTSNNGKVLTAGATAGSLTWADPEGGLSTDMGHNNVGSLCFACPDNTGNTNDTINPGSTFAGSRLKPCATDEDQMYGTALSGTWRCLGYGKNVSNFGYGTLWQRIA